MATSSAHWVLSGVVWAAEIPKENHMRMVDSLLIYTNAEPMVINNVYKSQKIVHLWCVIKVGE